MGNESGYTAKVLWGVHFFDSNKQLCVNVFEVKKMKFKYKEDDDDSDWGDEDEDEESGGDGDDSDEE